MKRLLPLIACAVALIRLVQAAELSPADRVIPRPRKMGELKTLELGKGKLKLFFTPEVKDTMAAEAARRGLVMWLKRSADGLELAETGREVKLYGGMATDAKMRDLLGDAPSIPEQGYIVKVVADTADVLKLAVAAADPKGLVYGFMTVGQLIHSDGGKLFLSYGEIEDHPVWPHRYISEDVVAGSDERYYSLVFAKISAFALQCGGDWRKFPVTPESGQFASMKKFHDGGLLDFMFLIHIYVTPNQEPKFNIAKEEDIAMLAEKCRAAAASGVGTIMICVDDYTRRVGDSYEFFDEEEAAAFDHSIGRAHGHLMRRLYDMLKPEFPDLKLAMVGAPYSIYEHGIGIPTIDKYVIDWNAAAPPEVDWVWTGPMVCSEKIERSHYETFKKLLPDHDMFVWDNSDMFDRPITCWNTEFYPGMERDCHGVLYVNNRVFFPSWAWAFAFSMTVNDYLWNPEAYDSGRSFAAAVGSCYGWNVIDNVRALREKQLAAGKFLASGDRDGLKPALAELKAEMEEYKKLTDRSGKPMPAEEVEREINAMDELINTVVPRLTVPRAKSKIVLDGVISEPEWEGAAVVKMEPRDGSESTVSPTARLLYGDDGLYIAVTAPQPNPLPEQPLLPHDASVYLNADSISIFVQPSANGNYAQWCYDYVGNRYEERGHDGGFGWDPDWRLAVKRNEDNWTSEVFLPFNGFETVGQTVPAPGVMWKINLHRIDNSKKRTLFSWSPGGAGFHAKEFFGEMIFE